MFYICNYDGELNGVFDEVDDGLGNWEGEQRPTPQPILSSGSTGFLTYKKYTGDGSFCV